MVSVISYGSRGLCGNLLKSLTISPTAILSGCTASPLRSANPQAARWISAAVGTNFCLASKRSEWQETKGNRRGMSTDANPDVVLVEKPVKHVAIARLNRPAALNALNDELCRSLLKSLKELDADDEVHAIIITGAGDRAFAAGADIKEMQKRDFASCQKSNMLSEWSDMLSIRKPIIAAVNGVALGGGCELAMMCDIVIASSKGVFGQPEILLGTIPGMGGSQRLVRAIGKSKAMEMVLTGKKMSADEAERAGLVSRVVEPEKLQEEAIALAQSIAAFSQPAVIAAKECVNRAFESSLQEGLLFERRLFHSTFANDDRKEGMSAFIEKRPAVWKHQ